MFLFFCMSYNLLFLLINTCNLQEDVDFPVGGGLDVRNPFPTTYNTRYSQQLQDRRQSFSVGKNFGFGSRRDSDFINPRRMSLMSSSEIESLYSMDSFLDQSFSSVWSGVSRSTFDPESDSVASDWNDELFDDIDGGWDHEGGPDDWKNMGHYSRLIWQAENKKIFKERCFENQSNSYPSSQSSQSEALNKICEEGGDTSSAKLKKTETVSQQSESEPYNIETADCMSWKEVDTEKSSSKIMQFQQCKFDANEKPDTDLTPTNSEVTKHRKATSSINRRRKSSILGDVFGSIKLKKIKRTFTQRSSFKEVGEDGDNKKPDELLENPRKKLQFRRIKRDHDSLHGENSDDSRDVSAAESDVQKTTPPRRTGPVDDKLEKFKQESVKRHRDSPMKRVFVDGPSKYKKMLKEKFMQYSHQDTVLSENEGLESSTNDSLADENVPTAECGGNCSKTAQQHTNDIKYDNNGELSCNKTKFVTVCLLHMVYF